jgi:hypothetical protein
MDRARGGDFLLGTKRHLDFLRRRRTPRRQCRCDKGVASREVEFEVSIPLFSCVINSFDAFRRSGALDRCIDGMNMCGSDVNSSFHFAQTSYRAPDWSFQAQDCIGV